MLPDAYLDQLSLRDVARLAVTDASALAYLEARMREPAAEYPPHGTVVGHIELALYGQVVRAELLSTGRHCRTHGVRIGGQVVGVMGADRAWRTVSRRVTRMMSVRHLNR